MEYLLQLLKDNQDVLFDVIQNTALAVLVIITAITLSKILKSSVYKGVYRISKQDDVISDLLARLSGYVVYLIGTVIILDLFGVNTTSLVALVGAAGLAIGLALKDTLSNVAAGVMLLFLKPFKKKEYVDIGGTTGTVTGLSLFVTNLMTPDGVCITIPNSSVWSSTIKNYSRNPQRRIDITIGIDYSDSIDTGLSALRELIDEENRILHSPKPQFLVHTLADSSVNIQLRAWCQTPEYWDIYWSLQKAIKAKIEDKGLSIPFPQRTLHIQNS